MQQVFSARLQHLPPISLQILALRSASALPSEIDVSLDFLSLPLSLPLPPQPPPALQWCIVGSARWKINSWEGWYLFFIASEIQVWGSTEKCKGEAKVGMAKSGCGSRWGETQQGKALRAHVLVACRPAARPSRPHHIYLQFHRTPSCAGKGLSTNPNDLQRWDR